MSLASEAAAVEGRIAQLERQQAYTAEVLRLILMGRWTGDMPHAEALVKAISPSDTDWAAVPFPKS